MAIDGKTIVVVMPAYNAEKTLERTYNDLPRDIIDHIVLVDDCSRDNTVEVAQSLGLRVIRQERNRGYGGNQKVCYDEALRLGADMIVMVHPDHQYDPRVVPDLIRPLVEKRCDAVFGSRMLGGQFLEGGMPVWKFYGNVFLTAMGNIMMKKFLTEWHSGFRAYTRRYLETVQYHRNADDFVFDIQIIVQGLHHGMLIGEVPIGTRYFEEASQIGFRHSVKYGLSGLMALLRYKLHIWGIKSAPFLDSNAMLEPEHQTASERPR